MRTLRGPSTRRPLHRYLGPALLGLSLFLSTAASAAVPPIPSRATFSGGVTINGKNYASGPFTLTTSSSGAHHYHACRSGDVDVSEWGGCEVVFATFIGSSVTVSGTNLPSDGFRRAYRFKACDAANNCTTWADNDEVYVQMDTTGPAAPGPTTTTCAYTSGGNCWVKSDFTISVTPAADGGSGVNPNGYKACRSQDSPGGFIGCEVSMMVNGGTSFTVSGSNLPSDGYRRSYWFRATDWVGNPGSYNTGLYVRVDRYNPTVSADNASTAWFVSRTATVAAADATVSAAASSGLQEVRYRWNAAHNGSCTTGTVTGNGAVLTVPAGDNHLYLCAKDNTGRIGYWNGGPYRVIIDSSELVSATLPTALACGATFNASVTMKNTGSVPWTRTDGYKLGAVGDSDPFAPHRIWLPSGVSVAPGQIYTFSWTMTAPSTPGTYTTDWRMVHELVRWFGPTASSNVTVSCIGSCPSTDPVEEVPCLLPAAALAGPAFRAEPATDDEVRRQLAEALEHYALESVEPSRLRRELDATGRLTLTLGGSAYELELEPVDLRAPGYREVIVTAAGEVEIPPGLVSTFKGRVRGMPDSDARLVVDPDLIMGSVEIDGRRFFIDPAYKFAAGGGTDRLVIYEEQDLQPEPGVSCAMTELQEHGKSLLAEEARLAAPEPGSADEMALLLGAAGTTRVVEVATDADGEYYALHGTGTNAYIQGVLNMVNGLYSETGLVFTLSYQRAFSNPASDPYSTCHYAGQWCELWSTWQLSQGSVHRDVVHLFSGKALRSSSGTRIRGYAGLLGTVCNLGSAYVLSTPYREAGLVAHEIGHALGALHVDGQVSPPGSVCPDVDCGADSCQDTSSMGGPVMCGAIQNPVTGQHQISIDEIMSYVNSSGACLAIQ